MISINELAAPWKTAARGGVFGRAARGCRAAWKAFAEAWMEAMELYARAGGGRHTWGPF
jgi:hypothetical protein